MAAACCATTLALGLSACGSTHKATAPNSGPAAPSSGPTAPSSGPVVLRFAASTQSGGYPTPFAAVRGPGVLLTTFMFDTLAFPDVTGQEKPWLAQSWQKSADGKTWTFHLHPNATWQDGTPLTSADVVFSFNYDLHGPGKSTGLTQGLNYIQSVTAPDPATVVIKLSSPQAAFLSDVAGSFGVAIVPQHIWAGVTDPKHFQGPTALIGSGPYHLKSFDLSTGSYDFVANDNFYLGKPAVQEVQIVPETNPLVALQQGQLTSASTGNGAVPQSELSQLGKQFKLLTAPGEFNEALFFNLAGGFPFDNATFRQAVAYALNRQDMLQRLVGGRGIPGSAGGLGPDNPYLDKNLPPYAFDPTKAKALLDQVGLKLPAGATFRVGPGGTPFTIPLLTSSADIKQAQLVQQYLRAVGLDVKISAVDQATSDAADGKGNYKMAIVHFGGLGSDPSGLIHRFASNVKSKSFTRVSGFHNATFDRLAAQQATTVNVDQRKQLVDQMQAILAQELPELPLYIPEQTTFVNTHVFQGWAYTPACPPCGAGMNKRMLVTGNATPAPTSSPTA